MGHWERERVLNSVGGNTVAWGKERDYDACLCHCCGKEIDDDCKTHCADCLQDMGQEKE